MVPSKDHLVLAFLERREQRWSSFINVLLELGPDHPAGRASVQHLQNVRSIVRELADAAGLHDTEAFARSWHILMKGSIIAAAEGDHDAARHAQRMARDLIHAHRPAAPVGSPTG